MTRGQLRVFLGAAPGVGKTYSMLEEGRRLIGEGEDVVVAVVETHGRSATAALVEGLEIVPRTSVRHRGVELTEMDVQAVLARQPRIALVDELAHTNAPGLPHPKRWQDVEALLDAGINVISTVNVQHIESLNDVVRQITGVPQRETIPDSVLRTADQIEVVDLSPSALRDRLSSGLIYPSARVDAALSNYFRLGNLTALRELTLLWLADEVDSALTRYRAEKGIASNWAARERVVVALTGGPEGQTLLRRGARIAARSAGGELHAVHITMPDGLRPLNVGELALQRALVEKLGGQFHQVVGSDIPLDLVNFARGVNASQLVIGVSRRPRLAALLSGPGIGATVIRESGDIDVHIVTHAAAGGRLTLPRIGGALTPQRRLTGFLFALACGPLLTLALVAARSEASITSDVLAYQLLVVVAALIGGIWPALFAAVLSGITLNFYFIDPLYTLTINSPTQFVALILYVINAVLVSLVVDRAARRSRAARRAAAESELLATVAGGVLRGGNAIEALLSRTVEAFALDGVRLQSGNESIAMVGEVPQVAPSAVLPVGEGAELELFGRALAASDRRLLATIAAQLDTALGFRDLTAVASEVAPLAEADRVRTALLAAVGHDLRRPLAAATAAVTGLRSADVDWSSEDRNDLLETAEQSLGSLAGLVTDLLDVSRLQAGVLGVAVRPVGVEEVVLPALEELGLGPADVELDLPEEPVQILADPGLLQRVLVNLLANAQRFNPAGQQVVLSVSRFASTADIRIIDTGPGISEQRRGEVFVPFQRLGDTDNQAGLGLGMALSKGFAEGMGGTLDVEDTPGGGATMVITLPLSKDDPFAVAPPARQGDHA